MHTLILGGQKSGKSRAAEARAAAWLGADRSPAGQRATLLATAWPGDDEMRLRIARHQADRAERVPGLATQELAGDLAQALQALSTPDHLLVVDCLTLWLTQLTMPPPGLPVQDAEAAIDRLCAALPALPGPVVLVSNEIGLGVMPLGAETRRFLDALGLLDQRVAALCSQVTLRVAGLPLHLKGGPA
ncbi:bifunctional adenosylcobinamide kinase/adenosylcobinamide-phosphate guanylyltransferase [Leptothrix discophora]|uniref:Bifunctional adenosylcobalamin biosynthesis protein n=1 Tax=Leptothrix discophora TaxID=89 RepID=A0ABT9G283_LEPDI|nr:bifunctional adenosylcobinamide kinase/adenosylcobinamide-phosphate guanylyltransferase [Leptothrix discophora]MDP4300598.1 bifunctional adenosylcobinamide kinase/adenosylcobinamide-phosphate guanylyltransferase [Leptothrix discophora]